MFVGGSWLKAHGSTILVLGLPLTEGIAFDMSRIQTIAMVLRAIPDFTAEYRRLIDALQTVGSMLLSSNRRSAFKLV